MYNSRISFCSIYAYNMITIKINVLIFAYYLLKLILCKIIFAFNSHKLQASWLTQHRNDCVDKSSNSFLLEFQREICPFCRRSLICSFMKNLTPCSASFAVVRSDYKTIHSCTCSLGCVKTKYSLIKTAFALQRCRCISAHR